MSTFHRVFSAYIKEIDEKPAATEWGSRMPFANMMAEFTSTAGMSALLLMTATDAFHCYHFLPVCFQNVIFTAYFCRYY